jgi:L-fuconolactonase
MPAFPLTDAHVHFWDPAAGRYAWLDAVPALAGRRGPAEFARACGPVTVDRLVFVQCGAEDALAEVAWVDGLAAVEPRLAAIVAHAPVEAGAAVEPWLEQLASRPRVRGVRRLLQDEPDDAFCLRPEFVEGVRRLERFGLSFDLCLYARQLGAVVELVRRCPGVHFILDHAAKPGIRAGRLDPWREEIRTLAALPNVDCKLSGLATEADPRAWTAADLRPYVDHLLATFGPGRLLFGGDWPVSTLATDYPRWVATLDDLLAGVGADDQRRIWSTNAARIYRL